jgi:two-component system, LytTR family, sensor kinase
MKRKHIILIHVIFWAVILVSTGLETIPSFGKVPLNIIAGDYFIYAISYLSLFYLYYFFISKKHLAKKKTALLIILGLLFTIIISAPVTCIYIYFLSENILELSGKKFLLAFGSDYFRFLETNFMFAVCGSLLKIALLWYENIMKQKETEKQFISGELALLRSQINPRFLLNTLTYIKSLIEIKSDKAIYSIENLSEIMSYMLYETSADKVLLDDEINYINNYLNLQKVRFCPNYIDFAVNGDTSGILVPPLLFMPFLENAFKYGEGFSETPGIIISLGIRDNNLFFEVMNYIKENANKVKSEDGFSVKSIKRFLDLQFGNNYSLGIKNEDNKYLVTLNVKLS